MESAWDSFALDASCMVLDIGDCQIALLLAVVIVLLQQVNASMLFNVRPLLNAVSRQLSLSESQQACMQSLHGVQRRSRDTHAV